MKGGNILMSDQQTAPIPQDITVRLEIVPEDGQEVDITDIDEVSREIVDSLRDIGYTIEPVPTGAKGIYPAYDIVVHVIEHHEQLLTAIIVAVSTAVQGVMRVTDWMRMRRKQKALDTPLKVTLEANGRPVTVEGSSVEEVTKVIQHLQQDTGKEITAQSGVKMRVQVSRRSHR
jgi:hypothetical protein